MLGAVDFHALGQVIWVSFAAGIGVTVLFSFAIYGFSRSTDARRDGQALQATAFGALAVLSLVVFAAVVVLGVTIMLKKS
jgi:4-amino-4-deoxy-L-arabinose transferase-like glycosyltransferase